jgi:hypothetical protein
MTKRKQAAATTKRTKKTDRIKPQLRRRSASEQEADRRAANTASVFSAGGRKGGFAIGRERDRNKRKEATRATAPPQHPTGEQRQESAKPSTHAGSSPTATATEQLGQDLARQIICREFCRMADRGYGKFRVRSYIPEHRVQFQGEKNSRWESLPNGNYDGEKADRITAAMESIQNKRNTLVRIRSRQKSDQKTFEVSVEPTALQSHRSNVPGFFAGQLFWE